jgi:hypothetical protein
MAKTLKTPTRPHNAPRWPGMCLALVYPLEVVQTIRFYKHALRALLQGVAGACVWLDV